MNTQSRTKVISAMIIAMMIMSGFSFLMVGMSNETSAEDTDAIDREQISYDVGGPMVTEATEEEYDNFVEFLTAQGISQSDIDANITYGDGSISIMPTLFFIPVVVGMGIGLALYHFFGQDDQGSGETITPPPGDTEGVRAQLRQWAALDIHNTYNAALGMFERLIRNDVNILRFTQAYWNLMAESVTNQMYVPNSYPSDFDRILEDAGIYDNLSVIKQNMNQSLNMFSLSNSQMSWTLPGSDPTTYNNSNIQAGWTFGSYEWWSSGQNVYMTLADYVYATPSSYRVGIDVVTDPEMLTTLPDINAIWTTATGNVTITNADNPLISYTLTPGKNDLGPYGLNIQPGWYNLSPNIGYVSQNFMASLATTGTKPTVGFILNNGPDYALGHAFGNGYRINYQGTNNTYTDVSFAVRFMNADGTWEEPLKTVDSSGRSLLVGSLDAYARIWETYNLLMTGPNGVQNAIQVTWNVLDALEAQQGSYVIRPTAILGGLNQNLNLPVSVQTAIVVASMRQLIMMGAEADPSKIFISKESLGESGTVYVYGNVYVDGILIAQNAVFTPLFYGANKTMRENSRVILSDQPTVILAFYATDVSSMAGFVPMPGTFNVQELQGANTEIEIFEIWVGNEQVSNITFEIFEAQYLGAYDFGFVARPGGTVNPSTQDFWMGMAVFFAGLSVLLAGLLFRGSPVLIIIGAVMMMLGIGQISFGLITQLIAAIKDFFSFGWLPFRLR